MLGIYLESDEYRGQDAEGPVGPIREPRAVCRQELVLSRSETDPESVVGDECHIVSPAAQGPRHVPGWKPDEYDGLDNLMLLCKVHHKLVDDQAETYTVELLRHMKANHEKWVASRLTNQPQPFRIRRPAASRVPFLIRITSGVDVLKIVSGAYGCALDNDDLQSDEEVSLVGGFLQELRDWGELGDDMEPTHRVQAGFGLTKQIERLEAAGFWVFGAREMQRLEGGDTPPMDFRVGIVRVVRARNPEIMRVSPPSTDSEPGNHDDA